MQLFLQLIQKLITLVVIVLEEMRIDGVHFPLIQLILVEPLKPIQDQEIIAPDLIIKIYF